MFCVEGFHNYHHTFPWDYRATELPLYNMLTPTIVFIEAMAKAGFNTNRYYECESNSICQSCLQNYETDLNKIWYTDKTKSRQKRR